MRRGFWLLTILRNGEYVTIADNYTNPLIFLKIEQELGYETYLINQLEITEEEYDYFLN
jgi:hypothetical protein